MANYAESAICTMDSTHSLGTDYDEP